MAPVHPIASSHSVHSPPRAAPVAPPHVLVRGPGTRPAVCRPMRLARSLYPDLSGGVGHHVAVSQCANLCRRHGVSRRRGRVAASCSGGSGHVPAGLRVGVVVVGDGAGAAPGLGGADEAEEDGQQDDPVEVGDDGDGEEHSKVVGVHKDQRRGQDEEHLPVAAQSACLVRPSTATT